jgi:hypothetical protein
MDIAKCMWKETPNHTIDTVVEGRKPQKHHDPERERETQTHTLTLTLEGLSSTYFSLIGGKKKKA